MAEMDEIMTDDALSREEIIERMKKCRSMIGNMCSEGRPPKMQIPAKHDEYNEDIYICDTLRAAEKLLDTPPKPAAMRSAESWALEWNANFPNNKGDEVIGIFIKLVQHDALASAKTDGVAVVRQLRDALKELEAMGTMVHNSGITKISYYPEFAKSLGDASQALAAATAFLKENGG